MIFLNFPLSESCFYTLSSGQIRSSWFHTTDCIYFWWLLLSIKFGSFIVVTSTKVHCDSVISTLLTTINIIIHLCSSAPTKDRITMKSGSCHTAALLWWHPQNFTVIWTWLTISNIIILLAVQLLKTWLQWSLADVTQKLCNGDICIILLWFSHLYLT